MSAVTFCSNTPLRHPVYCATQTCRARRQRPLPLPNNSNCIQLGGHLSKTTFSRKLKHFFMLSFMLRLIDIKVMLYREIGLEGHAAPNSVKWCSQFYKQKCPALQIFYRYLKNKQYCVHHPLGSQTSNIMSLKYLYKQR